MTAEFVRFIAIIKLLLLLLNFEYDLSWSGWQWAVSVANLVDRPPTGRGSFTIVERVAANAYRLDLPGSSRCHPVFNVTALKPYKENVIPGRRQPAPPSFSDLDGSTRFMVEAVLDHRRLRSQIQYLVHWKGYPLDVATWEPRDHLLDESGKPIVQLAGYVRQHPH